MITETYDLIVYEIPKKSEYLTCLRLNTSGIANMLDFTIDDINDIKLVVTEAATYFLNNIASVTDKLRIEYKIYNSKLSIKVCDLNTEKIDKNKSENEEMFMLIMDSLVDSFEIEHAENCIKFEFICK